MQRNNRGNSLLLKYFFVTFFFSADISVKSETYQKEGWFILEVDNQVFGESSEASESIKNLESEDFIFNSQNKEEAKNNLDSSVQDIDEFIGSLIQDIPSLSEEEISAGIEKIHAKAPVTEAPTLQIKTDRKKKVTLKVLFAAAVLSILSFSCLFVMGNHHNISIENGFVSFAKDTMQVVFFGDSEEKYITVDALLTDLEAHGFEDILFPQEFVNKSDKYKVSVPVYSEENMVKHFSADIYNENTTFALSIYSCNDFKISNGYHEAKDGKTIKYNDIDIHIFSYEEESTIEFVYNGYCYRINAITPYSEMLKIAQSIK